MPTSSNVESTLIHFKHGTAGNWKHWTSELEKFLYRKLSNVLKLSRSQLVFNFNWNEIAYDTVASSGEYFTSCSFDKWPADGKVCNFDIKLLGTQCTKEENFGYERGRPCIVLKLNRIFGWIPEPYDDLNDLPANMPTELKEYIKTKATENKEQVTFWERLWFKWLKLIRNFALVENDLGLVWRWELCWSRTYWKCYIHTIPWIPSLLFPIQKRSRLS